MGLCTSVNSTVSCLLDFLKSKFETNVVFLFQSLTLRQSTFRDFFISAKKAIYTSDEDSEVETKKARKLEKAKGGDSDSDSARFVPNPNIF